MEKEIKETLTNKILPFSHNTEVGKYAKQAKETNDVFCDFLIINDARSQLIVQSILIIQIKIGNTCPERHI